MAESRDALQSVLLDWLAAPDPARFDGLAARVVRYQAAALPAYGRLVASRGGFDGDWRDAPLVPTALFRDLDLCSAPAGAAAATFRTSGTTTGARGRRRVPDLTLYHAGMRAPFIAHVLDGDPTPRPWISLIPSAADLPDSSLSHMVTTLAATLSSACQHVFDADGLDAAGWRAAAATVREPVVVLTTSFALMHLLEALGDAPTPLPPGSRLMLTGGFKGKFKDIDEHTIVSLVARALGLPGAAVVSEYGMTELTSQAYGHPGANGRGDAMMPLVPNPSLRLRVLDVASLTPRAPGGPQGVVACFDLLNLDNVSAVLTSDVGRIDDDGRLLLHGRVPGAILRGCSLTAEELLRAIPGRRP